MDPANLRRRAFRLRSPKLLKLAEEAHTVTEGAEVVRALGAANDR